MFEAEAGFFAEPIQMLLEVSLEFLIGRAAVRCQIFGQEFEFLSHPSSDTNVVLIEAHSSCLAVEHLFAHVVVDKALHFLLSGWTHPRATEAHNHALHLALGHNDLFPGPDAGIAHPARQEKDSRPEQEEME